MKNKREGYVKARPLKDLYMFFNKKKVDFIPSDKNQKRMNSLKGKELLREDDI